MTRNEMPTRRPAETFHLAHTWMRGTDREVTETMMVTVGRRDIADARIGEVFIRCENHMNERAINLWHDIAVLISFALQHGASVTELYDAMAHDEVNLMGRKQLVEHTPAGTVLRAMMAIEAEDAKVRPSE